MSAPTVILTICLVGLGEMRSRTQKFLKEPESISVQEGENVSLSCRVKNKVGVLQWTKDDFGLGTSRDLAGFDRYSMIGQDGQTWDLQIVRVTPGDAGRYQCTMKHHPIKST